MQNAIPPRIDKSRLYLTIALPYANGPLHLGHATEAILGDTFARHRRLCGQDVMFLCADDTHGTATERLATERGMTPERVVAEIGDDHRADYAAFDISFDHYGSSNCDENRQIALNFFQNLKAKGYLQKKEVRQLFDKQAGAFLDDRRVRGTCPECGRHDQYGDSCECGATYEPTALKNPVSTLTGERPTLESAEHFFFELEPFRPTIEAWLSSGAVQPEVAAKLSEWLDAGLRPWCITRKGPYFGFAVPGEDNLFLYVWLDAPVTYIAAGAEYLAHISSDRSWQQDWCEENTEIVHVIGKDIVNFHGLFWVALLAANGCRPPDRLHAHGFITVGGEKMSKSRGNFVVLSDVLAQVDRDALRYAIASRLGRGISDLDLDAQSLTDKVNTDLVGKVANIAVRLRPFQNSFESLLSTEIPDFPALDAALEQASNVLSCYEALDLAGAVRGIMALADDTNRAIAKAAPWNASDQVIHDTCTQALVQFRIIAALLQPLCPDFARRCLAIFGETRVAWAGLAHPPLGARIEIPTRLMDRVDLDAIDSLRGPIEIKEVSQ